MKKYFLTGLVTLLPLAVTIWVIHFVVRFLTKPFMGITTSLLHYLINGRSQVVSEAQIRTMSQILILIVLFFTIFMLGFIARKYFFNQLIRLGDRILHKIPLVNKVYKTSKEIVKALFMSKENSFKQVVMLSFPYKGCYCLGLIARNAPRTCEEIEQKDNDHQRQGRRKKNNQAGQQVLLHGADSFCVSGVSGWITPQDTMYLIAS